MFYSWWGWGCNSWQWHRWQGWTLVVMPRQLMLGKSSPNFRWTLLFLSYLTTKNLKTLFWWELKISKPSLGQSQMPSLHLTKIGCLGTTWTLLKYQKVSKVGGETLYQGRLLLLLLGAWWWWFYLFLFNLFRNGYLQFFSDDSFCDMCCRKSRQKGRKSLECLCLPTFGPM